MLASPGTTLWSFYSAGSAHCARPRRGKLEPLVAAQLPARALGSDRGQLHVSMVMATRGGFRQGRWQRRPVRQRSYAPKQRRPGQATPHGRGSRSGFAVEGRKGGGKEEKVEESPTPPPLDVWAGFASGY